MISPVRSLDIFDSGRPAEELGRSAPRPAIFELDLDGKIRSFSDGALRLFDFDEFTLSGAGDFGLLFPPSVRHTGRPRRILEHAARHERWEGNVQCVRSNGSGFAARLNLALMRSPTQSQSRLWLDVQESRPSSSAAGDDARFRALLESAPDAMVIVTRQGEMVLVNSQTERLFGYSREEMLGKPVELLIPERFRERHVGDRHGYFGEPHVRPMGASLDLYALHKKGHEFPVELSLSPFESEDGLLVSASIRDVTDRKRIQTALREKNTELERANRAKDSFLAGMSHELRTPLNAVIGFTGTLLMELAGPLTADQRDQLQTIEASASHLLSLINDLLDLARIESGKVEMRLAPVDLGSVTDEVLATVRPMAKAKDLRLESEPVPVAISVRADRRALTQILLNLVSNAIKFTASGGVRLSVVRSPSEPGRVDIRVSDTGVGISAADQSRLFQQFEQLVEGAARQRGSGLGLYLSQKLAQLMQGEVRCESRLRHGSTFTLSLRES